MNAHISLKNVFKTIFWLLINLLNLNLVLAQTEQKKGDWNTLKLAYDKPTEIKDFSSVLPIGNGRIGAKLYGMVASEGLNLNETTLWSGSPTSYNDPNSAKVILEVRKALAVGAYKKADSLSRFMQGKNNQAYQPLGNLHLDFNKSYTNYSRVLDLDQASETVKYQVNGINYTREVFVSYPDQVTVRRIFSNKKGLVSFRAT